MCKTCFLRYDKLRVQKEAEIKEQEEAKRKEEEDKSKICQLHVHVVSHLFIKLLTVYIQPHLFIFPRDGGTFFQLGGLTSDLKLGGGGAPPSPGSPCPSSLL